MCVVTVVSSCCASSEGGGGDIAASTEHIKSTGDEKNGIEKGEGGYNGIEEGERYMSDI